MLKIGFSVAEGVTLLKVLTQHWCTHITRNTLTEKPNTHLWVDHCNAKKGFNLRIWNRKSESVHEVPKPLWRVDVRGYKGFSFVGQNYDDRFDQRTFPMILLHRFGVTLSRHVIKTLLCHDCVSGSTFTRKGSCFCVSIESSTTLKQLAVTVTLWETTVTLLIYLNNSFNNVPRISSW